MYIRPDNLADACAMLAAKEFCIVSGATDLYAGLTRPRNVLLLDLSKVPDLLGLTIDSDEVHIGAAVTWSRLRDADLPPFMKALQLAAGMIGGAQIQNRGTIGGNICNASPAADSLPPLLALGAEVELVSIRGRRRLSLRDFLGDGRRTLLNRDEILAEVVVPAQSHSTSSFLKLGRRQDVVIAVVSLAAVVEWTSPRTIGEIRICVGAASRVPMRLYDLERKLAGIALEQWSEPLVDEIDVKALTPIDDLRASAGYRRHAAAVLLDRLLRQAVETSRT